MLFRHLQNKFIDTSIKPVSQQRANQITKTKSNQKNIVSFVLNYIRYLRCFILKMVLINNIIATSGLGNFWYKKRKEIQLTRALPNQEVFITFLSFI